MKPCAMLCLSNALKGLTFDFSSSAIYHGHIICPDIVDWRTGTVARPATPITITDANRDRRNPSCPGISTSQGTQNTIDKRNNVPLEGDQRMPQKGRGSDR